MGIDAKRIGLCLWKCLKLSIITSSRYPFLSGTLILVLLLYIFLPSASLIVACSSPFLAIAAVFVQFYLKPKRPKSKNVKVVSIKDDDIIILRNDGTAISRQMSRRRNFKDKNKPGWGARGKRDDLVSLTATSIHDLLGLTPEIEDKPKVLLEVNEIGSLDDNAKEVLVSESSWKPDFTSHSRSNEQCHNNGGKVEIEDRNKRLETLIAKRRARKLRLQDGESPVDADMDNAPWPELEIAPILVSRANRFDHFPRADTPMPGSAPPILLPAPNPFDLPYDPLEERPNLRGDSFHEEFIGTQPKDKFLCRHESFSLGSFFKLEPKKDRGMSMVGPHFSTAYRESERVGYPGCRGQPKGRSMSPKLSTKDPVEEEQAPIQETNSVQLQHEKDKETDDITTRNQVENSQNMDSGLSKLSEVESSQNMEETGLSKESKTEAKAEAGDTKDIESSASSSASDSSDEDHIYNANIAGVSVSLTSKGRNFPNMIRPVKRFLASIPKKKNDSTLSAADKAKREEFFYVGRSHHAHSYSLASDMQVEVSDDGSPPPIGNEAFASNGDGEKETNSGGEDMWGPSTSSVGGIEKQQLTSGEVHDSSEEAIREAGSSGVYKCSKDPLTEINLSLPSVNDVSEKGQPNIKESDDKDDQLAEDIGNYGASTLSRDHVVAKQLMERFRRIHPSFGIRAKIAENANVFPTDDKIDKESTSSDEESKWESDTLISHEAAEDIESVSQNVAEKTSSEDNPGTLTDKIPTTQSSIVHNLNETLMGEIMNEEKLQSVEHGELESKASIIQEPIPELVTNVEELSSRSVGGDIEGQSQHSSDSIQSVNGEPEALTMVEEHIPEPSTSVDESNSKSTKDIEDESNQSLGNQ